MVWCIVCRHHKYTNWSYSNLKTWFSPFFPSEITLLVIYSNPKSRKLRISTSYRNPQTFFKLQKATVTQPSILRIFWHSVVWSVVLCANTTSAQFSSYSNPKTWFSLFFQKKCKTCILQYPEFQKIQDLG